MQEQLIKVSGQTARAALGLARELRKARGPHAEPNEDEVQAQALIDGVVGLQKWVLQQVRFILLLLSGV